jgi:hypothetical protein
MILNAIPGLFGPPVPVGPYLVTEYVSVGNVRVAGPDYNTPTNNGDLEWSLVSMPPARAVLVELGSSRNLAAAQAAVDAAVAASILVGYVPEDLVPVPALATTTPKARASALQLLSSRADRHQWWNVTACVVVLLSASGRSSVAALAAAIQAEVDAQVVLGLQPSLRATRYFTIAAGDVVALLFTNGTPPQAP